ncbi:hypothetical protein [Micromonospora foliorum]|uniref:hypothetical protein n=1 Tax=Micromonospora foliorum TaxID=2911210 RepID=UPI001EE8571C|nr:hypothetical protein [Micromonospora foliorum]MCG5434941.1 hypothetical protein [Micromonospora foliorum]
MGDGLVDELERYIADATVTAALRDWAAGRDAVVRPPCHPTRRRGHSDAELIPVIAERRDGRNAEQLYVKVLPAGQATEEAARHARAATLDPGFAERHLVGQPYPPYPVRDGRYLMFQDIAHGAEQVVALADVGDDQRKDAYRALLDGLWNHWYRQGRRTSRTTVGRFVRRELTDAGAQDELSGAMRALGLGTVEGDWLHDVVTGAVLPHPQRFAATGSLFDDDPLDQLCGASHGDLHARNVLYACSRAGQVQVKKFCLVDTDRFAVDAPLTRDQATLLLDAVRPDVANSPRSVDTDALRALLVDPEERPSDRLSARQVKAIKASYSVGLAVARTGNWGVSWRAQYLLSLLSQALICCTYEDAGRAGRAWYFQLAAYAAHAYQREFRRDVVPPAATGLPSLPQADPLPQLAFPGNDQSARFNAVGPQPSQQNRGAPLDRMPLDQTPRPLDAEAPARQRGGLPIPQRQTSTGWYALPHRPVTSPVARSTSGWPSARDGGRRVNRPAPRHTGTARTTRVPRPRRPAVEEAIRAPTATSRINRLPPKVRAVLAILLGGVSLTPLVAIGATAIRGRDEARVVPTTEATPGTQPSTGSTPAVAGRSGRLTDLALTVAGIAPTAAAGAYTVSCLRVWAPADLAPGVDRDSYRDETLWWTAELSGRRVVTPVTNGRRSGTPETFRYLPGDLSEIPPAPSVDPQVLRQQLTAELGELPPELRTGAGMLNVVSRIFRYHRLSPGQISALLFELATTPGIQDRGAYLDWNSRPGLAFSADDTQDRRETVQFNPLTGELLSHQTTTVADEQILGYVLFLDKGRTDRTTAPDCS